MQSTRLLKKIDEYPLVYNTSLRLWIWKAKRI